jgi:hypothetical protein
MIDLITNFSTTETNKPRKKRNDANKPRNKYDKSLPKEYKSYISRANNKGIAFDLSIEEFYTIVNKDCVYCGAEGMNGLDKVNPKGGYTKDNIVPCCFKCNTMKFIYSQKDFIKHINKIHAHQNFIKR